MKDALRFIKARHPSQALVALLGFIVLIACVCLAAGLGPRGVLRALTLLLASLLSARGLVQVWPQRQRLVLVILGLWLALWTLHLGVRGFLDHRYGMQPNSVLVVQAVLNTTIAEAREYVTQAWVILVGVITATGLVFIAMYRLARRTIIKPASAKQERAGLPLTTIPAFQRYGALGLGVVVLSAFHLSSPNRRENPVVYWSAGYKEMRAWNAKVTGLLANRAAQETRLSTWAPRYGGALPNRTVILVLGESVNRWNWSLYGYPRKTTPQLDALRQELIVFRDVISSAGNTIPEIERKLTIATHDDDTRWRSEPTVLMLARAAGYKVFWLSNQADRYINAVFARDAHVFKSLNVGGHRGDKTLDGGLVPLLDDALQDPAEKKLIIVHMLGAHPHYELRYPPEFAQFNGRRDSVRARLEREGRFFWVRLNRDLYDNAMLYQDDLLARMVKVARDRGQGPGPGAALGTDTSLLFVSDHAQEVGHLANTAGHTFKLESGFTVPLIVWSNRTLASTEAARQLEARPYQTDKLDWTLLPLLGIKTTLDRPEFDLLGRDFQPFPRVIDGQPYVPCSTCAHVVE